MEEEKLPTSNDIDVNSPVVNNVEVTGEGSIHSSSRTEQCINYCEKCFSPCLTKFHNPPKDGDSRCYRLQYGLMCPPHGKFGSIIFYVMSVLITWGVLWAITGDEALPGGNLFALLVVWVCAVLGGAAITLIKLPPLLGMLIVGVMLRNIPYINVAKDIEQSWSITLRNIAFTVILIRAGLGLDAEALKKLKVACLRLAFTPCTMECITTAIIAHFLLGFPWAFGFMLGFVLAAVSPAVVVPSMLNLHEKGYGVNKGIPTLVIAAASVDDVLAITGFSVVLGIAFSTGTVALTIVLGFVEVLIGVCFGIAFGIIMWYIPHQPQVSLVGLRSLLLFASGLLGLFGSAALELSGSGALAVLTIAFVAAYKWKATKVPVQEVMSLLWTFFQPYLFSLIGAEILIGNLDASTIGLGIGMLAISLSVRMLVSFLSVFRAGLNLKEKCFIPLAWLPKATVQAAIGSIALDTAREKGSSEEVIELGKQILTIAVLSIIITAPLGAAAIALSGPRLLNKTTSTSHKLVNQDVPSECASMLNKDTGV